MNTFKTITNDKTGNTFIVFAEGLGLTFGIRAWVESKGGDSGKPQTELAMRFRVQGTEGEDTTDLDIGKACSNLFPNVVWGNGSSIHRSAVARLVVPGMINGTSLIKLMASQGALGTMYKAWVKALSTQPAVVMSLTEDDFVSAIIATMEGAPPNEVEITVNMPFSSVVMSAVLSDQADAAPISAETKKAVGLN